MKAILFLAFLATVAYGQYTLCQRLLPAAVSQSGQTQIALVTTLVVRAFAGVSTVNTTLTPFPAFATCTGLVASPKNMGYFNGQKPPMKNFITDMTAQATLVDHLVGFFMAALGCFEGLAIKPYTPNAAAFKTMHAPMNIDQPTMDEFVAVLTGALLTFMPAGTSPSTVDLAYMANAFSKFQKGGSFEVCNQADCKPAVDFAEYRVDATSGFWLAGTPKAATVAEAMIAVGGNVHWDLAPTTSVMEVADMTATTMKTGGFTSGAASAATFGYNHQFTTAGKYYWYSPGLDGKANRGTITVGTPSGASQLAIPVLALLLSAVLAIAAPKFF